MYLKKVVCIILIKLLRNMSVTSKLHKIYLFFLSNNELFITFTPTGL